MIVGGSQKISLKVTVKIITNLDAPMKISVAEEVKNFTECHCKNNYKLYNLMPL